MRVFYGSLGFLTFGLGTIGIVMPVLPTTPFYLLTVYFFSKSSRRFSDWFEQSSFYKHHLEEFMTTKAMTKRKKWQLMIWVDTMLLISFLLVDNLFVKLLLGILAIIKYWYFFTQIKTIPQKE
ncbi:MAG: YbaN family protein [Candidatus Izemoplasma sp.]|nr:YbaN family protein [Candidatus Izemoplasma sp.]